MQQLKDRILLIELKFLMTSDLMEIVPTGLLPGSMGETRMCKAFTHLSMPPCAPVLDPIPDLGSFMEQLLSHPLVQAQREPPPDFSSWMPLLTPLAGWPSRAFRQARILKCCAPIRPPLLHVLERKGSEQRWFVKHKSIFGNVRGVCDDMLRAMSGLWIDSIYRCLVLPMVDANFGVQTDFD